jgi:hypothetical protein
VRPDSGPARALRIEIEECRRRQEAIVLDLEPSAERLLQQGMGSIKTDSDGSKEVEFIRL